MQPPLLRLLFRFVDKILILEGAVLALLSLYCWMQGITQSRPAGDVVFFGGVVVTLMGLAAVGAGGMRRSFTEAPISHYYRGADAAHAGDPGHTNRYRTLVDLPNRAVWSIALLLCGLLTVALGMWLSGQSFPLPWG